MFGCDIHMPQNNNTTQYIALQWPDEASSTRIVYTHTYCLLFPSPIDSRTNLVFGLYFLVWQWWCQVPSFGIAHGRYSSYCCPFRASIVGSWHSHAGCCHAGGRFSGRSSNHGHLDHVKWRLEKGFDRVLCDGGVLSTGSVVVCRRLKSVVSS